METSQIIEEIKRYFANTLIVLPEVSSTGKITISQPEKFLKLDITNNEIATENGIRTFQLHSLEQASSVIKGISNGSIEQCKTVVDNFIQKHSINANEPLYLTAYFDIK